MMRGILLLLPLSPVQLLEMLDLCDGGGSKGAAGQERLQVLDPRAIMKTTMVGVLARWYRPEASEVARTTLLWHLREGR